LAYLSKAQSEQGAVPDSEKENSLNIFCTTVGCIVFTTSRNENTTVNAVSRSIKEGHLQHLFWVN